MSDHKRARTAPVLPAASNNGWQVPAEPLLQEVEAWAARLLIHVGPRFGL